MVRVYLISFEILFSRKQNDLRKNNNLLSIIRSFQVRNTSSIFDKSSNSIFLKTILSVTWEKFVLYFRFIFLHIIFLFSILSWKLEHFVQFWTLCLFYYIFICQLNLFINKQIIQRMNYHSNTKFINLYNVKFVFILVTVTWGTLYAYVSYGMQCSHAPKGEELQFRSSLQLFSSLLFFFIFFFLFPSQIQILFFEADMQMKRN